MREMLVRSLFRHIIAFALFLSLSVACACVSGRAIGYKGVDPKDFGFSPQRLYRLTKNLENDVEDGIIPGAVVLIGRKGKIVHFESIGMQDKRSRIPMARDSIFRIYSMSEPIVSVAVMMLCEEKRLRLSDPVSKYLPELSGMQVGIEKDGKIVSMVSAKREITVKDLLTHTSGFTYGIFGTSAIKRIYIESGIHSTDQTIGEMTKKLGKIPLLFRPGSRWEYGRSTDVLGRLIEVVSGIRLDRFLKVRIFGPLAMKDSGFYVPRSDQTRLAQINEVISLIDVNSRPLMLSAGSGLVSTALDYYRFLQMLLNLGELEGRRFLKKETVKEMTRDHLGALSEKSDQWYLLGKGYGFGLGVAVRKKADAWKEGSVGDYFWGGYAGTYFWVDPKKEVIAILMIQSVQRRLYYRPLLRKWVYGSIKD
jgi:CubicO group peptidase (beta-lactamase class C family)